MQYFIMDLLECPACHQRLRWEVQEKEGDRIQAAEARCQGCGASYPVREGIGVFLTPDLPRADLWEQVDSGLARFLREHPEVEPALMDTPLESLSPADQFFRALVHEERGELLQAHTILERLDPALYSSEYLICHESQILYLIDHLHGSDAPIVDLACGRGQLVEAMARATERPILGADFSPRVLRRDCRWLELIGLSDRVSLLAFDARRTPFRDGAVQTLTTNLGLANIHSPGVLLKELRRVVSGEFLAISYFFPPDDLSNKRAIDRLGLSDLLYRANAQRQFLDAGWRINPVNVCQGRARPTPKGRLLEGAEIDSLPAAETLLEWSTLRAY